MSLGLLRAAVEVEQSDMLHQARLLLLLLHISQRRSGTIEGITKLAKMDFFLRYPLYLRRLLQRIRKRPPKLVLEAFEEDTIESKMIRFKYGPWDKRYRTWISLLGARGLCRVSLDGQTVYIRATEKGLEAARSIAKRDVFRVLDKRSELVVRCVGSLTATRLKNLTYEIVPELTEMPWGKQI